MFSSFFSATAVDPTAQNLYPVSSAFADDQLFGELEPKDTEWLCPSGFSTETQVYYIAADDGTFIMCQVIHSAAGLWYPTIQFVFKLYDPKTKETIWKSVNVTNFVTPPPGLDKRSCKADEFSIAFKPASGDKPDTYTINANLIPDLQLNFELTRPSSVPGYKIGKGPKGGYTYFGPDTEKPEGYVVHRFWPYAQASGLIVRNGTLKEYKGSGAFIHAIQGMRPNLIASAWNFANFQSSEHNGVSAIQMEFTTCDTHGPKGAGSGPVRVNIGSLVIGGKLIAVTAETNLAKEKPADGKSVISRATHLNTVLDPDTQYMKPNQILYEWQGKSLISDAPGDVKAKLEVDLGDVEKPKGLIEKVDVLAEIPYVIKMAVNYVAGTKPYIYQFLNPTKLHITGPDALAAGLSGGLEIDGVLFNEATFIS